MPEIKDNTENEIEKETTAVKPKRKRTTAKTTKAASEKAPEVRVFDKEDLIPCMSVTTGELVYHEDWSKSHTRYEWIQYGDVTEVEYQDLKAMLARKSDYLFYPHFIVTDEDFLKENPKLQDVTNQFYGLDNPRNFFDRSPVSLEAFLNSAPEGVKDAAKTAAAKLIKDGELDSIRIVKTIDSTLGTEFAKLVL